MKVNFTKVEEAFFEETKSKKISTRIPYITTESFPKLGLLSALSFLEWASKNPKGVACLPTGKTAQYFLDFTHLILDNWNNKKGKDFLEKYGLADVKKPDLSELSFVQMGEFFPINPEQHNSLYNYAQKQYIDGLGFKKENALLLRSSLILKSTCRCGTAKPKHTRSNCNKNRFSRSITGAQLTKIKSAKKAESAFSSAALALMD
jgi:glucosamine-6-phosphate deaminase